MNRREVKRLALAQLAEMVVAISAPSGATADQTYLVRQELREELTRRSGVDEEPDQRQLMLDWGDS